MKNKDYSGLGSQHFTQVLDFFAQWYCSVERKVPLLAQNKDKRKQKAKENLMGNAEHFFSCYFEKLSVHPAHL